MSVFEDRLIKEYSSIKNEISKAEYNRNKETMPVDEFKYNFTIE